MTLNSQTYNQLPLITAPKIHTDLLWDLSFLFIGLAVVYFIFVFFYRNRISARGSREKQRKRELSPMVSEFLFYEEEASKDEKSNYVNLKIEIRQLLKDEFNRKILSEVLLDLRKDVSGDTQKRLFKLYQDLGLHNDDFTKLKSWRWEIVSKGILDLTQMQVSEAYSFITKFINDKRHTIRKQAEIAIVTLKPEGINYFLDTTKYKISEWQQLKLMDVLRMNDDYQPPRFKAWLTSTNRHVVLFALRLIKFYNQNDADSALIELVKHKNSQIKEAAIGCIKEFHVVEALPVLKLVFWKSSTDVKISILNAIGELGNEADIEFLRLIENKESNFSVRSKAHSSINAIAPDSIMPSKGLLNTANYKIPDDIPVKETEEEIEIDTEEVLDNADHTLLENIETDDTAVLDEEITIEPYAPNVPPNQLLNELEGIVDHDEQEEEADQAIDQSEEIIEIEIQFDPMEDNKHEETNESAAEKIDSKENETLCFDFLPLVVHEISETNTTSDAEALGIELNEILVDFEEVSSEEVKPKKKISPSVEIKEEEIAFLPIVTDIVAESAIENNEEERSAECISIDEIEVQFEEVQAIAPIEEQELSSDYSQYKTFEILDAHVIYDEVADSSIELPENENKTQTDPYSSSVLPENLLEDTMDVQSKLNPQTIQSFDDMTPQDEQKFKKIIADLIDFNERKQSEEKNKEFKDWPLLEFGDAFVDASEVSEIEKKIKDELQTDANNDLEETALDKAKLTIPKALHSDHILEETVYYEENTEESRMQLLDDISEMGDQREIPLLKELLINAKYKTVKDRAKSLIIKFSDTEEKLEQDTQLKPFNVFEDLFRTCDTEAKLILMDEIVAVGDEAEIGFLESLLEDEEKEICNKAARILEELKLKLSPTEGINTANTPALNTDNIPIEKRGFLVQEETFAEYDFLMEELKIAPPQTSEIFDLAFELSEPLSKTVENDSSKNSGYSDSFLGQICAFSNKIIDRLNG